MGTESQQEAIEKARKDERDRCAAIIEMHRNSLEPLQLFPRLWNMIRNPECDPRKPDYSRDRLPGM